MNWPNPESVYWDDWLLLVIQVVSLAIVTVYVWKTWEMASATRRAAESSAMAVQESRDARMEALAPRVLVYFDGTASFLAEVAIQNAGAGTAADVRLEFTPPLQTTQLQDSLAFFDVAQPLIPPGYRLAHPFDTWPAYIGSDLPKEYRVVATYRGIENGRAYRSEYVLNADSIKFRQAPPKGVPDIVDELRELGKKVADASKRLENTIDKAAAGDPFAQSPATNVGDTARSMLALWDFVRQARSSDRTRLPWRPVLRALRAEAVAVVKALPRANLAERERESLTAAAVGLFDISAEVFNHTEWIEQTDRRMAAVEEALTSPPTAPSG